MVHWSSLVGFTLNTRRTLSYPHKLSECICISSYMFKVIIQLDGGDSSSDDDDVDDDDDDDEGADAEDGGEGEEEPLNSEDDDSDGEEEANLFEMDNVVVCQYDKVYATT